MRLRRSDSGFTISNRRFLMRSSLVVACCIIGCLLLSGCNEDATVYINEDCLLMYDDGSSANPLHLSSGDKVKWVNDNDFEVTIDLPDNTIFGQTTIKIKAGKSKTTTVKPGVGGNEATLAIDCGRDGGSGNPKVVVDDDEEDGG
jgi:hypothetical protein